MTNADKERERAALAEMVRQFQANGGKIVKCPKGSYVPPEPKKKGKRKHPIERVVDEEIPEPEGPDEDYNRRYRV